ncbi:MAG: Gp138 family membrane-puncturing spike protein [Myxococcota bacterium]
MSSATPSDGELYFDASQYTLGRIHSCLPATVVAFSPPSTVTVQPALAIRRRVPDSDELVAEAMPQFHNLPVIWPKHYTGTLDVGDYVTLVVADRSLDEWKATGARINVPQDVRRFNLTDAYVLPGGRPPSRPLPATAWAEGATVLESPDLRLGSSLATDPVVLLSKLTAQLSELKLWLDGHIHTDPVSGVTSAPTVPSPSIGDLGATKVKGE